MRLGVPRWAALSASLSIAAAIATLANHGLSVVTRSGQVWVAVFALSVLSAIASVIGGRGTAVRLARVESGRYRKLRNWERKKLANELRNVPPPRLWIHGEGGDDIRDLAGDIFEVLSSVGWKADVMQVGGTLFGAGHGLALHHGVGVADKAEKLAAGLKSVGLPVTGLTAEANMDSQTVNIAIRRP